MKINFDYCESADLKEDLENFRKFKNHYLDIITGRRSPNDDDEELERLVWLLDAETRLENLYCSLVEAETENNKN
jgi:hypothetical protein